jgi:hypothetical protein
MQVPEVSGIQTEVQAPLPLSCFRCSLSGRRLEPNLQSRFGLNRVGALGAFTPAPLLLHVF